MPPETAVAPKFRLRLTVQSKEAAADGVVKLSLAGTDLPDWEPGAHIELALPGGLARAYSIVSGDPGRSYELAILREPQSRGGSEYVHDRLLPGDTILTTEPKNSFALEPAVQHVFVAGGIGITPILPMIARLKQEGKPWKLYYLGRSRGRMAYMETVASLAPTDPDLARIHIDDEGTSLDLAALIDGLPDGTAVYTCGPNGLMDALAAQVARRPSIHLHMERFGRAEISISADIAPSDDDATQQACDVDGAFEVELRKTGATVTVGKGQTILECARTVRQGLSFSCSDGYCGTCETGVLAGLPDHRDTVLTDEEREANRTMMICVGRSRTRKLVLDL
ncbi:PDR/VanB family oxidoreductase (plasmid) [Shinella sp. H4-D48]|uniref:PDR/VanB family oxidoreductase n=1 Tax=Shinella sp. H4-D48 TaxID=2925841 RepID=UPI001F52F2F6|nr:PDR/VanB family oxidoreductase [Shinella sp. H4-D48]UNK39967.1 PDR/VanB family oxidoreductase [Shinella sp. H4-D48]